MLKGTTLFELRDVKTGKTERIEEQNMFTNGLHELFNKQPFGWFDYLSGGVQNASINTMRPIYNNALGGLVLFPQPIEENVNNIFASGNHPTGIASVLDNPNTDARRGSFNAIESGEVDHGFRYVYDFGTSQANGTIACASLTTKWAGATWLSNLSDFICGSSRGSAQLPFGIAKTISIGTNRCITVWSNSKGIYFTDGTARNIYKFAHNPYAVDLISDYSNAQLLGTFSSYVKFAGTSDEVWGVRNVSASGGNTNITIERMNCDTGEITTQTITVSASLMSMPDSGWGEFPYFVAYDENQDYLYMQSSDQKGFYRIKVSNPADVTLIETPTSRNISKVGDFYVGDNFIMEKDGNVNPTSDTLGNASLVNSLIGVYGFSRVYDWKTNTSSQQGNIIKTGCTPISPILMTINNLNTPVVKDSSKTMKVTYTVTQV